MACLGKYHHRNNSIITLSNLCVSASHETPPHPVIEPHPFPNGGSGSGAVRDQRDARRVTGRTLHHSPIYHLPACLAHILPDCDAGARARARTACV